MTNCTLITLRAAVGNHPGWRPLDNDEIISTGDRWAGVTENGTLYMWNLASNSRGQKMLKYHYSECLDGYRWCFRQGAYKGISLPLNPFHSEPVPLP